LARQVYLDNLKVLLIAAIIALHAILGYAATIDVWPYASVREVTLWPPVEAVLFVVVGPFAFFMIALLFLVAGLLTRPSLERKGTGAYILDRLLRLGVPFAVYVLLMAPALSYALEHPLGLSTGSYWAEFLGKPPHLEMGPLWFVGVLLIFSLAYAGWAAVRRPGGAGRRPHDVTAAWLLLLAAAVAPATFLVRLAYPIGSESLLSGLNVWEWPACIAAFALGIAGSRHGWLEAVPDRLHRQCRAATLLAAAVMAALMTVAGVRNQIDDLLGGRHWPALLFPAIESILIVFGSVWLLAAAQQHLNDKPRLGPGLSRSAYGAFMVQAPILFDLAVALRPIDVPAELKAIAVAGVGVAASFALAWLLISRVPGVARIL
jgi:Acyltransferase family